MEERDEMGSAQRVMDSFSLSAAETNRQNLLFRSTPAGHGDRKQEGPGVYKVSHEPEPAKGTWDMAVCS